jgi:hypothetical protein
MNLFLPYYSCPQQIFGHDLPSACNKFGDVPVGGAVPTTQKVHRISGNGKPECVTSSQLGRIAPKVMQVLRSGSEDLRSQYRA